MITVNNLSKVTSLIKNVYNSSIKYSNESRNMLGRWCHVNMPSCDNEKILKKIDFANIDNNSHFYKINKNVNKDNFKPQEYIDAFY